MAFSQCKGRAGALAELVGKALNEHGLPTHPVEAGEGIETLGWVFSEGKPLVSVTNKRLWKMRLASLHLIEHGKASGRTLERLVGWPLHFCRTPSARLLVDLPGHLHLHPEELQPGGGVVAGGEARAFMGLLFDLLSAP